MLIVEDSIGGLIVSTPVFVDPRGITPPYYDPYYPLQKDSRLQSHPYEEPAHTVYGQPHHNLYQELQWNAHANSAYPPRALFLSYQYPRAPNQPEDTEDLPADLHAFLAYYLTATYPFRNPRNVSGENQDREKEEPLSGWQPAIPITVGDSTKVDKKRLLEFPAFKNWLEALRSNLALQSTSGHTFEAEPWRLVGIKVHAVTVFANGKIEFMTIEGMLRKRSGKGSGDKLDRVVFLRGGSVAVLMILRPKDSGNERYVILTEQPRIGAASTSFLEIPAGMLDEESGDVKGKPIEEIYEETSLRVRKEELIDMTSLALEDSETKENIHPAMYPGPGNLDEYIPLLLWEKVLDRKDIEALKGKLTGKRNQDELMTLRVCKYDALWREGARDAKTLGAWALYEGLSRAGEIEEKLRETRTGDFEK
ncbi:hypothetical protein CC80DRAFT_592966 [Byssothecium circinans]|uniref:Nudix hydrolase domain-containing protein n=1 Tax=Byssothecium circinans TaxID=147558 RepID=A0A6A5TVK0_9PLEO|nr:hypothetical protein CC80DRAFT_592966 [Byssothecium circinans]